jgi:hypothetical protein
MKSFRHKTVHLLVFLACLHSALRERKQKEAKEAKRERKDSVTAFKKFRVSSYTKPHVKDRELFIKEIQQKT